MDYKDIDRFTRAYLEAAEWTECHEDNPDLEGADSFSESAMQQAAADCKAFQNRAKQLLVQAYEQDYDESQAGHDFWLTRNGHGAGFWDRSELDADNIGEALTVISDSFGETYLYVGDDNLLYFG